MAFVVVSFSCVNLDKRTVIVLPQEASKQETLAAKEVRRYIYLRTGKLLEIRAVNSIPEKGKSFILLGEKNRNIFQEPLFQNIRQEIKDLSSENYLLRTIHSAGKKIFLITGGDPSGTLYGAYEFAETIGIRFYLHGDVVPDEKAKFVFPELSKCGKPLFETRGIQPFHDFPEGPDWWTMDDYKAILSQLPKLKMNFIGFHTYPEGGVGPEPTVWIGLPEDLAKNGNVNFSYPARHFNTISGTWGYKPKPTSQYSYGASELFDRDNYGTDYMNNKMPWPENLEESNDLFNNVGDFFGDSFFFAHELGIQTCVGTETPLVIPSQVKERLKKLGKDPDNPKVIREIYQGMFEWIKRNYPLDYYWFWTPENWTWGGNTPEQLALTKQDIRAAMSAAESIDAPFTLATCGWVLGPKEDRAMFDKFLPKEMPMSCINRQVGFAPVENGFVNVENRPKWAIPWLEDDPAMIIPQLWAGRMRKDAADALAYGCTGLLGIHWRTRVLGPNISALAKAAWEQKEWKDFEADPGKGAGKSRDMPVDDFYLDWANANFGKEAGDSLGNLYIRLNGGSSVKEQNARFANLPRPANWVRGPGGIVPDQRIWQEAKKDYQFVDKMEGLRSRIKSPGNLERFDYWLNQFKYMRAIGKLNCSLYEFNKLVSEIKSEKNEEHQQQLVKEKLLPIRIRQMEELKEIYKYLLNSITTKGGLGNVANWEQHVYDVVLKPQEKILTEFPGTELSPESMPSKVYPAEPRIIVPTVRSLLQDGEDLNLKVILPGIIQKEASLHWRLIGTGNYQTLELDHISRAVYSAKIPGGLITGDLEYYIRVVQEDGKPKYFPATAPDLNQTVVIMTAPEPARL